MTKEEALGSKGKAGKVFNGYQFNGGKVGEVHSSGDYVKFERWKKNPKWYHREQITLHDPLPTQHPAKPDNRSEA